MSGFTKKAIIESFLHIAGKKPLDKITVRDIVDHCGVNRNTFYYHFQDIYAVLEEICRRGVDSIPKDASLPETLRSAFLLLSGFTERYPRAMRHIAISVGVEGALRYFGEGLDSVLAACLARIRAEYPAELVPFLRHAFLGLFMEWLKNEKRHPSAEVAEQLAEIGRLVAAGLSSGKN